MEAYLGAANPASVEPALTNERKLISPESRAERALHLLDVFLRPDGAYPENTIHSIYFESRTLRAYDEKLNGDNLKHKIRLRWYDGGRERAGAEDVRAFIEVKFRVGSARHKSRHAVSLNRRWLNSTRLEDERLREILRRAGPELGRWMSAELLPALHISYQRRRYRCPFTNGRVALDREIRVPRFHPDLFPFGFPLRLNDVVCEFKDAAQVDVPWLRHLYEAGFRMRSYSKFGEAIRIMSLGGAPT